jgi:hypothetical protein
VVTCADRPLSEQDVNLIREVLRFTPKLAILLTKVDLLNDRELAQLSPAAQLVSKSSR